MEVTAITKRSDPTGLSDAQRARLAARRRKQKLSRVFEMPDLGAPGEAVSAAEARFFVENGFLIKPGLVTGAALDAAMTRIWSHAVDHLPRLPGTEWALARDDPESWMNPQWAPMPPHPESGPHQGRQPLEYMGPIVKLHDIGSDDYLLDLLPRNPAVLAVANALLGDDLRPSTCTRGVYAVFPTRDPDDPEGTRRLRGAALGPHVDQVCQQLNVCLYLEDVPPRSGGFTVYPGSHALVFAAHEFEANWSPRPNFAATLDRVVDEMEPWELVAGRGAVVFWHGRTVHSAGIHVGDVIRWALFADYTLDRPVLSDDEHRAVGQYEWFKNAKLFREDWPASDDMWRHWKVSG